MVIVTPVTLDPVLLLAGTNAKFVRVCTAMAALMSSSALSKDRRTRNNGPVYAVRNARAELYAAAAVNPSKGRNNAETMERDKEKILPENRLNEPMGRATPAI